MMGNKPSAVTKSTLPITGTKPHKKPIITRKRTVLPAPKDAAAKAKAKKADKNPAKKQQKAVVKKIAKRDEILKAAMARKDAILMLPSDTVVPKVTGRRMLVPGPCVDTSPHCQKFLASGVCPIVVKYIPGICSETCHDCEDNNPNVMHDISELNNRQKIAEENLRGHFYVANKYLKGLGKSERSDILGTHTNAAKKSSMAVNITNDEPVVYIDFEHKIGSAFEDKSNHSNDLQITKGALSPKELGNCGRALTTGDDHIQWTGSSLKRTADTPLSIAVWVKLHKSSQLDWLPDRTPPPPTTNATAPSM
jgi:hypothetical protein